MIQIINQIIHYLNSLDWGYILTFILLAYSLNTSKVLDWFFCFTKVKFQTRYRVLLIGILYGAFLFFLRENTISDIESLLQSFVFALVFHKLILDKITSSMVSTKLKANEGL